MAKSASADIILSWSRLVPVSEGQDPLGLNLRVSARLGSQLLYCITSITPRARYYSFLPWCISVYSKEKKNVSFKDSIKRLEKAFTAGCVVSHDGNACKDGRLIGATEIIEWFKSFNGEKVNLKEFGYVKNFAIDAYFASLVNLCLFKNTKEVEEPESENQVIEAGASTHDLELSPLGKQVVKAYEKVVQDVKILQILNKDRLVSLDSLKLWGKKGGLCELRKENQPDRDVLTGLFFNDVDLESPSHNFRRKTLLLILFLAEKLSDEGCALNEQRLNDAVYFNQLLTDEGQVKNVKWPNPLKDIAIRWRAFYYHYYLSAVLENLFVNVVNQARQAGIEGFKLKDMVNDFNDRNVTMKIEELFRIKLPHAFLELTPCKFARCLGTDFEIVNPVSSKCFDDAVKIDHQLSERNLHDLLTKKEHLFTTEASIIALILWSILTFRYVQWEQSDYGNWLSNAVTDPYQDVSVPVVLRSMKKRFGDFWNISWRELALHLINKYVIQLHQILAYQKSGALFYSDQDLIRWRGKNYDDPSYGNPRFSSAILILKDLGLLIENKDNPKVLSLTVGGNKLLHTELMKEKGR